jgi:N-methylhydantoinase B
MTNTQNTPVESIESTYPLRVLEYSIRRASGGRGKNAGGDGIVRRYEFLTSADLTLISDRRKLRPWGLNEGDAGSPGANSLDRADGTHLDLPGKAQLKVSAGDVLSVATPGGGGWGKPPDLET